jgi:hypothetical protein
MSSIGAVSGSTTPPAVNAAPPKPKMDRDGDYDNNRPPPPGGSTSAQVGNNVNVKA